MIDKDYQLNINWCAENTAQLIAEERQYRKRIPSKQAIIADIMPYSLHQDKHFSGFVFCSAQNGIRSRTHGPASDLWCQGDNRETYTRLLGELGDSWYYKDKSIVYNINDYGYRAPKFSDVVLWKKTIPVFGCSMVYGIGLAEEHRFSNILEQTTNRKTINFGYPSGSNFIIFRNIMALINYVDPKDFPEYVVIGWTFPDRFQYYDFVKEQSTGPWLFPIADNEINNSYLHRNNTAYQGIMETYYIIKAIRLMLKDKCKLIEYTTYDPEYSRLIGCKNLLPTSEENELVNKARDGIHPGIMWNSRVHDYISGEII